VPEQETWSFPLADVIAAGIARVVSAIDDRPETAYGLAAAPVPEKR
jgi:hypothetical protein